MNFFRWLKAKLFQHKHFIVPVLVVILAPNILGFIFGAEFSKYPFRDVDTIIVNHDESATALTLVKMIRENETFKVVKESTENDDVEKYIKSGKAMSGIIIPKDFTYNITHGKEAKVLVFNDGALTSSGSSVRSKVSETLSTIKAQYMMKIAEGTFNMAPQTAKYVISPFSYETRVLGNPTSNIGNMMIEGVILTILQMAMFGLPAFIRGRKNFKTIMAKTMVCVFVGFISSSINIIVQTKIFKTPFTGSLVACVLILALTALAFSFLGMFVSLGAKRGPDEVVAKGGQISLTMLLSGYTFPVLAMPPIFSKLEFWMPNRHIIIPLRSVALLGCDVWDIKGDILWLVVFAGLMFLLVCYRYFVKPVIEEKKKQKKMLVKKEAEMPLSEMAGE